MDGPYQNQTWFMPNQLSCNSKMLVTRRNIRESSGQCHLTQVVKHLNKGSQDPEELPIEEEGEQLDENLGSLQTSSQLRNPSPEQQGFHQGGCPVPFVRWPVPNLDSSRKSLGD